MSNAEKYYFSEFTQDGYRSLIRTAKERFRFSTYTDFNRDEKFVLWRHDLDYSVHKALEIAQIEKEEGIVSTYFIHLHSQFYNFFEEEIFGRLKQIKEMGHEIGIHFDTHFYNITSESELERHLAFEKKLLGDLFNTEIKVFSFHNTTPFIMQCRQWQYAGLINTYADYFQKNVTYCSDSNGTWMHRKLEDVMRDENTKSLQVLTHPEWWDKTVMSPKEKIWKCIDGRAKFEKEYCYEGFKKFDRDFIDW